MAGINGSYGSSTPGDATVEEEEGEEEEGEEDIPPGADKSKLVAVSLGSRICSCCNN